MHCRTFSIAQSGHESELVQIEMSPGRGLSGVQLIGNVSELCRDGKERAKAALESLGIHFPPSKINVSFTPGDTKKNAVLFDVSFAVLFRKLVTDCVYSIPIEDIMFVGELGLDGHIHPVRGCLSAGIEAYKSDMKYLVVPEENIDEMLPLTEVIAQNDPNKRLRIFAARHLEEVFSWLLSGDDSFLVDVSSHTEAPRHEGDAKYTANFDDMELSDELKMIAMVVAHGKHSLLLYGSPGTGKSMFAQRLCALLPKLELEDHINLLRVYGAMGRNISPHLLQGLAPFRSPHHSASSQAILGTVEMPGELSLAHCGILFLDELNEFRRDLLESLREPLESKEVQISRAHQKTSWEAASTLIAAANRCPCGWYGSRRKQCKCKQSQIEAYQNRLSGPLLQRLDLHVDMEKASGLSLGKMQFTSPQYPQQTEKLKDRVLAAQKFASQTRPWADRIANARIPPSQLLDHLNLSDAEVSKMVEKHAPRILTHRNLVRLLRVSRTLADLDHRQKVEQKHIDKSASWVLQHNDVNKQRLSLVRG